MWVLQFQSTQNMNTNLIDTIAARSWIVKCKDKCNYSKHVKHKHNQSYY